MTLGYTWSMSLYTAGGNGTVGQLHGSRDITANSSFKVLSVNANYLFTQTKVEWFHSCCTETTGVKKILMYCYMRQY